VLVRVEKKKWNIIFEDFLFVQLLVQQTGGIQGNRRRRTKGGLVCVDWSSSEVEDTF
jgi:hypothetical protein